MLEVWQCYPPDALGNRMQQVLSEHANRSYCGDLGKPRHTGTAGRRTIEQRNLSWTHTIPTVLGISESGRLLAELRKESVPVRRVVVNQIVQVTGEGFKQHTDDLKEKEDKLREALEAAGAGVEELEAMLEAQGKVVKDAQSAVTFCSVKSKDQRRAMQMLDEDTGLKSLQRIEAPLFDMEIRGVPALQFMGGQVWTD